LFYDELEANSAFNLLEKNKAFIKELEIKLMIKILNDSETDNLTIN
jgi:hypothetical protein